MTYNINIEENALEGKEITRPANYARGGRNEHPLWTGSDPESKNIEQTREEPREDPKPEEYPQQNGHEQQDQEGRTLSEGISYPSHILSVGAEQIEKLESQDSAPEEEDPEAEEDGADPIPHIINGHVLDHAIGEEVDSVQEPVENPNTNDDREKEVANGESKTGNIQNDFNE